MADIPTVVEPAAEYLGVACHNCQNFVTVIGPLDPVQMPPDQPMRVGSRAPLQVECPQCKHRDAYPIVELLRRPVP